MGTKAPRLVSSQSVFKLSSFHSSLSKRTPPNAFKIGPSRKVFLIVNLAATSAGSKQSSQIRRDSLAVPRYRPYRSPGRDDHYQNGEHFRGAKRIYKRNSSQSLEQLGLASHSPQESGRTAPNLQNQKSSGLNDSEHEDPDPAWLGAIDYHNFLSVAVNCQTSTTLSANAATQTGTATFGKFADTNGDLAIGDISICSDRPSPKPELAKKRCKLRSKTL